MNYTLVLYKSDGCNTCRGCVMEQWGSDFDLDVDIEENDAINKIVGAFTSPSEGGAYSAHLVGVFEETNDKYDHGMLTPTEKVVYHFGQYDGSSWRREVGGYSVLSYHCDQNQERADADAARINQLIREKVAQTFAAQEKVAADAKAKEEAEEAKQKELYERQQLVALQQKYK